MNDTTIIFCFVILLAYLFAYLMHKFTDSIGSSIAYGAVSSSLFIISGAWLFSGFSVIDADLVGMKLNDVLALLLMLTAIVIAYQSIQSYKTYKEESEEEE